MVEEDEDDRDGAEALEVRAEAVVRIDGRPDVGGGHEVRESPWWRWWNGGGDGEPVAEECSPTGLGSPREPRIGAEGRAGGARHAGAGSDVASGLVRDPTQRAVPGAQSRAPRRFSFSRALPFPRDMAARAILADLGAFIHGRPPGGAAPELARRRRDLASAREMQGRGDHAGAEAIVDALLADDPNDVAALRLQLAARHGAGRTLPALRTLCRLAERADTPPLARLERRLTGELLVADCTWVPALPGGGAAQDPDGPSLVLAPTGAAVPPAVAVWVTSMVIALDDAGLRPVVLGRPVGASTRGQASPWGERPGIEHRHLDLGAAYPGDAPGDLAIVDHAWAAAAEGRRVRPARVVALLDPDDATEILVGLALRTALGCPLAALTAPLAGPGPTAPTAEARLASADLVVRATGAGALRADEAIAMIGALGRVGAGSG